MYNKRRAAVRDTEITPKEFSKAISFMQSLSTWAARQTYLRAFIALLALAMSAHAQAGFATSEITNPIQRLVTIANATIAGLAILAVIFYAIRWIGGDEGAAKRIIGVIIVAVVALGAANFLGFITGRAEFDTFTP
jgi:type IV secretory pathway VirB2 component (pilin)